MAFIELTSGRDTMVNYKHYRCDTEADLDDLPDCPFGSEAYIIANGGTKLFMRNSNKEWIAQD